MIIFYKGLGIMAIIIPFLFEWLFANVIDLLNIDLQSKLIQPISFLISGIIVWFLGKKLNRNSLEIHSLFGIRFEYWGIVFVIAGLTILMVGVINYGQY